MEGRAYSFVAMRNGEVIEEPDLRRYAPDWFDTLHFQSADGDARMVAFPARGLFAVNGAPLHLILDGQSVTEGAPIQMRQYKAARSYFVGAGSCDVLRVFCLEAEFDLSAEQHVHMAVAYSFEMDMFSMSFKSSQTGDWSVRQGVRELFDATSDGGTVILT